MDLQAFKTSSDSSYEYPRATVNDFAELVGLMREFTTECDGLLFSVEDLVACPQSPGHPLGHLKESLLSSDSLVLLARNAQGLVGFLKFDRGQTSKSRHRGVFTMAIKQTHWGRGIGAALLAGLEKWAEAEKIIRLELCVLDNNKRAIGLYEKEGYVFEGHKQYAALVAGSYVGGYWMAKILKA